jgi:Tetratricopeptide repeat
MNDVYTDAINKAIELHKKGEFDEAEKIYNRILNRKHFNEDILFLLSDLYIRQEKNGLGINLLCSLLMNNEKHGNAWLNLGTAYRKENFYTHAKNAWKKAIEIDGETAQVCNNMAGLYADHGQPERAIEWCDKALAQLDCSDMRWQKSLALLSLKRWEEGWKLYEDRYGLENWHSRIEIDAPIWDFKETDHLYLHGEQGVGDEVMFLSCLDEVKHLAKKITLEVNEKVVSICQQTWPDIEVISEPQPGNYTAKLPIGSLACKLRATGEFPGTPYMKPNPERIAFYRSELQKLGKGPYLALTWFGGSKQTRVEERSINLELLKPFMDEYTCVSAQYQHTNPMLEPERQRNGLTKINDLCIGLDIAEQAALFCACDAVVTVQQTAVLVAGSVGKKCFVLTPARPSWVMGVDGDRLPWFEDIELIRLSDNEKWESTIKRAKDRIDAYFGKLQTAKSAVA